MIPRTVAFPFQDREHLAHRDDPAWGYCWDPGTGKTRAAIMDAAWLEERGKVDGMLVVAPNGVHRNWATDELPRHLPEELESRTRVLCWHTGKTKTQRFREGVDRFLLPTSTGADAGRRRDFAVLIVSYHGLMTDACAKVVRRFLETRRCLLVADESQYLKTPGTKWTIRMRALRRHARYVRILTGTLVVDKPFDVYPQIALLDPDCWRAIGCDGAEAFRSNFGVFEMRSTGDGRGGSRLYPELKGYRNLHQLHDVVARHVSRIRKEEVLGDLPPKLYSRRYFEVTPEQRRVYREIRDEAIAILDGGAMATAPMVITRIQRMQQVLSGWIPTDDPGNEDAPLVSLCDPNPRIRLLLEAAEGLGHQALVWAKYRRDIDLILEALRAEGLTAVRYDGACDEDECAASKAAFKAGDAQFFVSNPSKGGTGLTLNEGKSAIWYGVTHKLGDRLQAEDRNHRIGQDVPVNVIDLIAMLGPDEPSIDLSILEALVRKREWASVVQGDEIRDWLR